MILVLARALVAALSLSLWLESVGYDLGAGESLGGGAVPVPLVGPVGLPHHEPQLLHPGLHLPLLYVSPSHPLLAMLSRFIIVLPQLSPAPRSYPTDSSQSSTISLL